MRTSKTRTDRALDRVILAKVADTETNWDSEEEEDSEDEAFEDDTAKASVPDAKLAKSKKTKRTGASKYVAAATIAEDERVEAQTQKSAAPNKAAAQAGLRRDNALKLCAYEWTDTCGVCGTADFSVLSARVERDDGTPICAVTGSSPLKTLVQSEGIALAEVCVDPQAEAKRWFMGRACPQCCCAQGEFHLARELRSKTAAWLDANRVLRVALPRKFANKLAERPPRSEKVHAV